MIKEIIRKRQRIKNTLQNQIDTLKNELLNDKRKIEEKDQLIFSLFEKRDELKQQVNELLEELKGYREKEARKRKW